MKKSSYRQTRENQYQFKYFDIFKLFFRVRCNRKKTLSIEIMWMTRKSLKIFSPSIAVVHGWTWTAADLKIQFGRVTGDGVLNVLSLFICMHGDFFLFVFFFFYILWLASTRYHIHMYKFFAVAHTNIVCVCFVCVLLRFAFGL